MSSVKFDKDDVTEVTVQCNRCAEKGRRYIFPSIHAYCIGEESGVIGYAYKCPVCGETTSLYDTQKKACDAWNKHLTANPDKEKKE